MSFVFSPDASYDKRRSSRAEAGNCEDSDQKGGNREQKGRIASNCEKRERGGSHQAEGARGFPIWTPSVISKNLAITILFMVNEICQCMIQSV